MKALKPSMKENKRYLLVRGGTPTISSKLGQSKGKNLKENIERAILDFIGILGMSKTGLGFIKTDKNSSIISINREMVDFVRASLVVWPEKITVEKVSGTLKGLRKK